MDYQIILCAVQGRRNYVTMECDVSKNSCGRAQKLIRGQTRGGGRRRRAGQRKQLCQSDRPERSHVVWGSVLQVVELQLQLAYSHVLGGQLILQPPQLILLPEEHPQELKTRRNADLQQESGTLFYLSLPLILLNSLSLTLSAATGEATTINISGLKSAVCVH